MDSDMTLASVYFRFDKQYDSFEREIYTFTSLLEDLGGFQAGLFFFGALLVFFF